MTFIISASPALPAQSASPSEKAKEVLTNADVVKMVQAHLGDDVILEQIRSHPAKFVVSTDDLIKLKQLGVPDKVISAMQAKIRVSARTSSNPIATTEPAGKPDKLRAAKGSQWQVVNKVDPTSGRQQRQAILSASVEDNGRRGEVQIIATCDDRIRALRLPSDNEHFLTFKITYISRFGRDVGFKQYPWEPVFAFRPVYGSASGPNAQKRFVKFFTRIDNGLVNSVSTSDYSNELTISFIGEMSYSNEAVGGFAQGYGAHIIRVQLPLANGDEPAVEFSPQDAEFKKFAVGCPGSNVHVGPEYTVEALEGMLPQILSKAAVAHGLDSHGYDMELEYIKRMLDTCAFATLPKGSVPGNLQPKAGADEYEICERNSYWHLFVGDFKDISLAAGNPHGKSEKALAPNDLMLNSGQPVNSNWRPGEQYDFSLKIFTGWPAGGGLNFDDVLLDARLKATRAVANPTVNAGNQAIPKSDSQRLLLPSSNQGTNRQLGSNGGAWTPPVPTPQAAPLKSPAGIIDNEKQAEAFYYKKQYSHALPLFASACTSGNQDGCGAEGFLYAFGLGVTADLARGRDLMTSSCESGSSKGCDALGVAYLKGVGVSQDTNKALDLFNRSCTGGFAMGCVNLSECYRRGIGQPQDKEKGLKIFDQACSTGHDQFAAACDGGDTEGCRELASCYLRGTIGGKRDPVKAKELFNRACGMGDKAACQSASNLH